MTGPALDERYKVAYDATTELMAGQHSVVDNLRQRATVVISATTVTTTFAVGVGFLGGGSKPLPAWTLYTTLLLVAFVGGCAFYILLPTAWVFGVSANSLIDDYIESATPSSLTDLYRDVAIWLEREFDKNEARLDKRFLAFRLGVVGLTLEVMALLIGLITR